MNKGSGVFLAIAGMFFGLLVLVGGLFGAEERATAACDPTQSSATGVSAVLEDGSKLPTQIGNFSGDQITNAALIIAAGKEIKAPLRAQAIAVMTAIGESSLKVLDHGDVAGPDSRGLFQQRANGAWGSLESRMDPRRSAIHFYRALLQVTGWSTLTPTEAAHRTQRNADPNHYTQYWDDALQLMEELTGRNIDLSLLRAGTSTECDNQAVLAGGSVVYPVPKSLVASNRDNWGNSGGRWARRHTGTDFSVPCGTPVLAAHGGTIVLDHTQAWAGPTLIKVTTGPGRLTTWYAHMQSVSVTHGQRVAPGEPLGEVGSEGNSTGCHLHFEVHPKNGSIYADNVDPTKWLASAVGKNLSGTDITAGHTGRFTTATTNAAKLTSTSGGTALARHVKKSKTDLLAVQDLAPGPRRTLLRSLGAKYQHFGYAKNLFIWRRTTFDLLAGQPVPIQSGQKSLTSLPMIVLRHRLTGTTLAALNVRNPAPPWRADAIERERAVVASVRTGAGTSVLAVGDFKESRRAYCPMTKDGLTTSPATDTASSTTCSPPPGLRSEQIFGAGFTWDRYRVTPRVPGAGRTPFITTATTVR